MSTVKSLPWLASRFLQNEREFLRRFDVPLPTVLKLWANGYFSYCGVFYDTTRLELYLSDADRHKTKQINGSMGSILQNKFVTKHFLEENYAEHLPQTYGLIRNGRFIPISSEATSVMELLDEVGIIVCTPIAAGHGKDVHIIEGPDELRIDGAPATFRAVHAITSELSDLLLAEYIQQHPFEASVYPDALNTMRIVTMIDPDSGKPFIGAAVHRFGVAESAPTDNWSRGAIASPIDPETGKLGGAFAVHDSVKWRLECHPETGTQIAGETVPNWQAVREFVQSAAGELATLLPYIGWDIAMAEDGTPIFIEGHQTIDIGLIQLQEPLLANERRRRFYEYHGVI